MVQERSRVLDLVVVMWRRRVEVMLVFLVFFFSFIYIYIYKDTCYICHITLFLVLLFMHYKLRLDVFKHLFFFF